MNSPPRHSVIIPHRNRLPYLRACLAHLVCAAATTHARADDLEVLVIHAGPPAEPADPNGICTCIGLREIIDPEPMPVFNKSRLLNRGIAEAGGELITTLDADMLVGSRWLEAARDTDWTQTHRLCYRVRRLPPERTRQVLEHHRDAGWADYDRLPRAFEAYGRPDLNRPGPGQPWGNSQATIHRLHLGAIRYDERYTGRGFEDLAFNRSLAEMWGPGYRGEIRTDAPHALLHLAHPRGPADWYTPALESANLRRYKSHRS